MAKTISQLNGGTVVTSLDGTELLEAEKDGVSVPITAQGIADLAGGGGLVYTALLTQSGTDAPVATVLQNTLGGTVVWTYNDVGIYYGTLAGAFDENKTAFFFGPVNSTGGLFQAAVIDNDTIKVDVYFEGTHADEELNSTAIEIRVYP